ncbi:MAG: hypothetical protein NTW29_02055 [Bacteroidetes bacterium]|nr:hypothetical protein [Bacteroidota bacterium]
MIHYYFKRHWDETTEDPLTNSWGTSTYYFETNEEGEVLRQIEVYNEGHILFYDKNNVEDEFGRLSEVALGLIEFEEFKIGSVEFEKIWARYRK